MAELGDNVVGNGIRGKDGGAWGQGQRDKGTSGQGCEGDRGMGLVQKGARGGRVRTGSCGLDKLDRGKGER